MKREEIFTGITAAMKARDSVRLEALRFVWSRIKEVEIDTKVELNDEQVITLLQKEVKSRKEAIEQFRTAGRDDLVTEEEAKLVILTELLPAQMSEEEIAAVVDQVLVEVGAPDFGVVMGKVMAQVKGKADGAVVQGVVRSKLS